MTTPAEQDAKVRFQAPAHTIPGLREAVLGVVRGQLGWPELGICQDETVIVQSLTPEEGGWRVRFAYVYDHDFASQYDMTDRFSGDLLVDAEGRTQGGTLSGEHD